MFRFLFGQIREGKSLARALMHESITGIEVRGEISDIGAGGNPEYRSYLSEVGEVHYQQFDLDDRGGKNDVINLETDALPHSDGSMDTVLLFNVLEHIYNYNHLVSEIYRSLKKDGMFIGFVPFLVNYHPDPHDYFRYTNEALTKIFEGAGFREVEIIPVGMGPFAIHCNTIMLSIPQVLRPLVFTIYYGLDHVFMHFRPNITKRVPLGYTFTARK